MARTRWRLDLPTTCGRGPRDERVDEEDGEDDVVNRTSAVFTKRPVSKAEKDETPYIDQIRPTERRRQKHPARCVKRGLLVEAYARISGYQGGRGLRFSTAATFSLGLKGGN